jgi:2-polyprenyl-6-methoxyphenol hydroxylase-like FAD-dependent oxidoreductase
MQIIIVGSGPSGLTLGAALARRGHEVVSFDPDPGPAPDGLWRRRGVMQFEHAHGFRPQVRELLQAQWPDAYDEWLRQGAEELTVEMPDSNALVVVRSRRRTYERALRMAAGRVAGLSLRTGRVERVLLERDPDRDRVVGVVVDGQPVASGLVVDASGRAPRLGGPVMEEIGGECGLAYVNRRYRLRDGAEPGPLTQPYVWGGSFDGFDAMVFPHERGHFSVVIVRPTTDAALKELRHTDLFDAACRAIPGLAAWTDPDRSVPCGDVLPGGLLRNVYRWQRPLRGIVSVGDAVATTTPTAGRGVAMASMQIAALLELLDGGADPDDVAEPFGRWCDAEILPWVEDHMATDTERAQRWLGADIDLSRPLTSRTILEAAPAEPQILEIAARYLAMDALPATLARAEVLARAVYGNGWRAPFADGPSRDELVAVMAAAHPALAS